MTVVPQYEKPGSVVEAKARSPSRAKGSHSAAEWRSTLRRAAAEVPPSGGRTERHRVAQGPSRQSPGPAVRRAEAPPPSPWTKSKRTTVHEEVPSRETNRRIHRRIRSESAAGVKPRPPDAERCSAPCARCAPDLAGPGMAIWRDAASPPPGEIKSNLIKLLKEKCGEEMKSGTNSGMWSCPSPPQRRRLNAETKDSERTAEKAHKSNAECFLRHFRAVQ